MKKVLIVVHWYPPSPMPSSRIIGLGKYLPEFGWQPIVLTSSLGRLSPQFRVIETPYRDVLGFWKKLFGFKPDDDIRKQLTNRFGVAPGNHLMNFIFTRLGEVINYPDLHRGWTPFAVRAGNEILEKEKVDAVLSSSMPIISHIIARELKIRHQIPWLADFRDLWSQNHNYSYGPLRRRLDRRLELKTVAEADALITVSEPWAEKLRALHKEKLVYTIAHGFDPQEVNNPPAKLTTKFTITYTGPIYPGKQDTSKLFAALRDLISDGTVNPDEIEVMFYGERYSWLDKEIEQYGLSSIVRQYGQVPREVAVGKQRESQLLLQLNWEGREKAGYSGKLFEYLSARRPILATGGYEDDVVSELLDETKAGRHPPTVEDIKNTLQELYQEYKLKGEIAYKGEELKVNKYTHREMARKFAEILNHPV